MGSGRRRSPLPLLLLLLLPPAAWGGCGPLPNISHADPPEDTKYQGSFSIGSKVTYRCLPGYVKRPLLSDTIQCLANSQWSNLPEFCGRSCPSPPHVLFARISQQDETQNFYAVNTTVKYICRQGYENTTDQLPTSTCLDSLTWSDVPKLCQRKSCGIPANPEHGKVITNDHLFGAMANVVCNRGYTLKGASALVWCSLRGGEIAWSQLPACQVISCPPPPAIPDGKHNGNGTEEFVYDSVVMYTCDAGLQLVGNDTLRCATENGVDGVWSGTPPKCRVHTAAAINQTELSEEKRAENPYWLASILLPSCIGRRGFSAVGRCSSIASNCMGRPCLSIKPCIDCGRNERSQRSQCKKPPKNFPPVALGILAGIIMRRKDKKHSHNMHLQKHETKGRDPRMPPNVTDDEKQPVPWHSYFCHTTSCHVCPTCEERLHAALAPRAEPMRRSCATCEDWLRAQPGTPRTYSVPSIGSGESQSPAGTSSPAKAADVPRGKGAGEAVPEQCAAEQPMDHESSHHVCPICEDWLRAHLGQRESRPAVPREWPGGPRRQNEGPPGPVCPPCANHLHLSLVHSDMARCPVCPLAGEGTPAHLVPRCSPGCHICPGCAAPTHAHLCQPRRQAPDG